ncbi:MAG TPA: hypothetical protein VGG16_21440 [Streptosporangiaceae bacterium]
MATIALFAVLAAGFFVLYLRLSRTYPENSDEANILLMAWDMMHGHVMLHGWFMSDVSFYTTELPEYLLLETFLGLHSDTAHVGAALTYTLVVLIAAILAKGKAGTVSRAEATIRMLIAAGIMIAPQLGTGVFVVLLSVGHIGTAVPLMLIWLVIDRGQRAPRKAIAVAVMLAWVLIADPLVLPAAIVPLAAVCLYRAVRIVPRIHPLTGRTAWRRAVWRAAGYEISLAIACGAGYGLGTCTYGLIHYYGGYRIHSVGYQLVAPALWPGHAWVTIQGWLAMFGAYPQGNATQIAFAIVHMIGVALVAVALWLTARRFLRGASLIDQVLLVSIVLNVALYVPSTLASTTDLNAREYALALPFGAVLAGRRLAGKVRLSMPGVPVPATGARAGRKARLLVPCLVAVLGAYLASLGWSATRPPVPAENSQLGAFLAAHNLTYGVSGYWQSSIVTVDTSGQVTIRAVMPGSLQRDWWESKHSWYDPSTNTATFLVTENLPGFYNYWEPQFRSVSWLGLPVQIYSLPPYTIYVWDHNILN